jgi:hypothetical protein
MMSVSTLVGEISAILGSAQGMNYSAASDANDVFEGYTLAIIVKAARAAGATISFETNDGNVTNNLVFRTAPGDIFSPKRKYTHAIINLPGCPPLEAHIGVKVSGKSGVLHECDVAVIDRHEARVCRTSKVHPRASKVLIAAECKFYASTLQLGLARGYLGLSEELSKQDRLLVTNTTSDSAAKMITYHKAGWEFGLSSPTSPQAADLEAKFKQALRNYVARRKS